MFCQRCQVPICALCVSSLEHEHIKADIFKKFEENKATLKIDLQELENLIYPKFQEILSEFPIQRGDLSKNSQQLKAAINKQGHNLHKEIDTIIKKMKADVDYMESKHLADLKIWEDEITCTISKIKQSITDIKKLYDSSDICRVCEYTSENCIFKAFSSKRTVSLPKFIFHQIDREEICQQFGFLLDLKVRMDRYINNPLSSDVVSRPLMDVPRILSDKATDFGHTNKLCHVTYVSNREIWISGLDGIIRLYILRGAQFRSIKTKSGNVPFGIAIIRFGDLVYADYHDRSLNIVKLTGLIHVSIP